MISFEFIIIIMSVLDFCKQVVTECIEGAVVFAESQMFTR